MGLPAPDPSIPRLFQGGKAVSLVRIGKSKAYFTLAKTLAEQLESIALTMSAFLESSSGIIGDYMLRGWTMTDRTCLHCHITPLMRQPLREVEAEAQRVEFCATCQGGPNLPVRESRTRAASSTAQEPTPTMTGINGAVNGINGHSRTVSDSTSFSSDDFDLKSTASQRNMDVSFEPTLVAVEPSVPAPASRTPSFAERDAQSARASGLIGNMLLRGFALLAESCPNSTCYGIPLVGHPRVRRAGGARDAGLEEMKKECVICHRVYNREGEQIQGASTEPAAQSNSSAASAPQASTTPATMNDAPESPRTIARRRLYEQGDQVKVDASAAVATPVAPPRTENEPQPSTSVAPEVHTHSSRAKTLEAVSGTIDGLVATLSMLNTELRNMLQQAEVNKTIKDKRMKRCLSRIRETMEALAVAEDLRAKLV
ncbi:hypothetical protein NliqN6_2668 [Naganishia liquefaciens]|uniref:Uncharacterized protein n=1 Tax=Naganishia liquefaciens TaxID=104408 RepID=A0A8H3TRU1_9TREE|nr:hypothetical protein NliqN6_2668 [Naganishia liquefaciens]